MGMEQFKTRAKANDGVRLTLHAPDGKPTDEYLIVRHVWSDAFIEADERTKRELQEWMAGEIAARKLADDKLPDDLREAVAERARAVRLEVLAALVSGWSFDAECTPEAVAGFLAEAPQIANQIDKFAADNEAFFGNGSPSSSSGSEPKSA